MKTKIYSLLVALMSVVAFTACDDWTPADQGGYAANTGGVSRAKMTVSVSEETTAPSRASVNTADFLVTVYKQGTEEVAVYNGEQCSWTYSAMPQIFTLPVGDYTVRVRSHEPEVAAWNAPYFEGSADFKVENNVVNYIGTVTCNFMSVKVEVRFSDELLAAMGTDSKVDVFGGVAGNSLSWSAGETRYGYFLLADNNTTVTATFSGSIKGQAVSSTKVVDDAKPGNYYVFNFSLSTGNPILPDEFGQVTDDGTGVKIDFNVTESDINSTIKPGEDPSGNPDKHPDTEEWPEEPGPGPVDPVGPDKPVDPSMSAIEIEYNGIDPDIINPITGSVYELTFKSEAPMTNIEVEIISPYLTEEFLDGVGMKTHFDLANPGELEKALRGFEFPVGNEVIGKTEIPFNLSPFIPMLALDDEPGRIHTFRITIKDEKGNVKTQDLKFQN